MTNQEKQEIKKKQEAVKKWNIAQSKAYLCGRYGIISADGKTKSGLLKTFALARELAEAFAADKTCCGA